MQPHTTRSRGPRPGSAPTRRRLLGGLCGLLLAASPLGAHAADVPLIEAVKAGDITGVQRLLDGGADPDRPWGDGSTALHWAAHRNDHDLVARLLDAGADANAADDHGVTPLSLACVNGSLGMVERLLSAGADPDLARGNGETALMTAARVGSVEIVRALLAAGADVEAADRLRGQTALMWAIAEDHTPATRLLLEVGGGVTTRTVNGFTPLLFAAQRGNIEVARLLLSAGADVNDEAPEGIAGDTNARAYFSPDTTASALLVAIDSRQAEMALFLLDRGADPNHDGAGRTPLHSAVQHEMPDVVTALLERGADPDARLTSRLPYVSRLIRLDNGLAPTPLGATPFWLAASFADLEIMGLLLEAGADPFARSDDGTTALMVAAGADFVEGQDKYGRRWFGDAEPLQRAAREAVEYLLALGADINATNDNLQTPLHGAVYMGGTMLAPYLVERGAEIDAINRRGQTPWMIAAQGEYRAGSFYTHEETGEVLAALGADTTLGFDLGKDFADLLVTEAEPGDAQPPAGPTITAPATPRGR